MKILVTICARGGSKGIPGKNIKLINGFPLIGYTIDIAKRFAARNKADIALSTDSEIIRKACAEMGLDTNYHRPEHLATDSAGKVGVIRDLLEFEEKRNKCRYDLVLDLDVTSPLRTIDDLEKGLEIIKADSNCLTLFSVNPANRNPYFNMVEERPDGYVKLAKTGEFLTRQSAPKVYDLNASFYFYRRSFFEEKNEMVITEKSRVYVMPHICFDLDEMHDFEFMEFLLKENKLGFQL